MHNDYHLGNSMVSLTHPYITTDPYSIYIGRVIIIDFGRATRMIAEEQAQFQQDPNSLEQPQLQYTNLPGFIASYANIRARRIVMRNEVLPWFMALPHHAEMLHLMEAVHEGGSTESKIVDNQNISTEPELNSLSNIKIFGEIDVEKLLNHQPVEVIVKLITQHMEDINNMLKETKSSSLYENGNVPLFNAPVSASGGTTRRKRRKSTKRRRSRKSRKSRKSPLR
jgi:hypothetical protein